jgi:hypothetical protein
MLYLIGLLLAAILLVKLVGTDNATILFVCLVKVVASCAALAVCGVILFIVFINWDAHMHGH